MRLYSHNAMRGVLVFCIVILLNFITLSTAATQTLFAADREWSNKNGWLIYKNNEVKGCIGEKNPSNKTKFLLGLIGDNNGLIIGFSNNRLGFAKQSKSYQFKLLFDGKRKWRTGFKIINFGADQMLISMLGNAARLRKEIARSSHMRISQGKRLLANISLKGSSATLKALDACQAATPEVTSNIGKYRGKILSSTPATGKIGQYNASNISEINKLVREATFLYREGNYAAAEPLIRRALALDEKTFGLEHPTVANNLIFLARILKTKGEYAAAEPLYRRALTILEKTLGAEHPVFGSSLTSLASLLHNKGDYAGAEPLYRRALAIHEKTLEPEHPIIAISLNHLASMLHDKGNYSEAEPLYRRALANYETAMGTEHTVVGLNLNNLASLLHDKGDYSAAEPLHRRALAILKKALGAKHPHVGVSLNDLANLLHDKGDFSGALEFARRAASIGHPNREVILPAIYSFGNTDKGLIAESFTAIQQVSNSSSGRALQSLSVRFSAGDGKLARLVRREQDGADEYDRLNKAILTELSKPPGNRNGDREKAIHSRIAELSFGLETIRTKLAQEFPEFTELSKPSQLKLAEAQRLLGDDEALVIIDVAGKGEGDDYVWALSSNNVQWNRLESDQGGIAKILTSLRASLDLSNIDRTPIDPAVAHQLYRKLLGPVERIITGKKHLLFVLNGAVSSLPPQILVTKAPVDPKKNDLRDVAWLVRDYAITILPTVSSLNLLRTQKTILRASKAFRGYGDPVFDSSVNDGTARVASRGYGSFFQARQTNIEFLRSALPRLPGTARELVAVGASLGAPQSDIVLGKAASETAIKRDKLDDYRIVYFATHGLVAGEVALANKNGAEPALAFTIPNKATAVDDGLLTASEVAQLKLNADWVVLSACNTAAAGKPGADALSGLARAFFYAGAKSLLVTHWVVDDDATAELMKRTFKFASGNPKQRGAEALRQAMLSVLNDLDNPQWADPTFWAPFVLVGQPGVGG